MRQVQPKEVEQPIGDPARLRTAGYEGARGLMYAATRSAVLKAVEDLLADEVAKLPAASKIRRARRKQAMRRLLIRACDRSRLMIRSLGEHNREKQYEIEAALRSLY
jgi:hypothetical protein